MNKFSVSKYNSYKFFVIVFTILTISIQPKSIAQSSNASSVIDYSIWDDLLQKHVNTKGEVDYAGFVKDKKDLNKFTDLLSKYTPKQTWTKNEKKAYLINAYNAFTIQLIVDNYPLKSIKNIGEEPFEAFKTKFINFDGKMISLDDIEKGMLLSMGDPRVHFAVNCASYSCPKLDNKVYKPRDLDKQLDEATSRFINSDLNIITKDDVKLSKIFEWYRSDFENESQDLIKFINKYSRIKIEPNTAIEYLDYSWELNSI